MHMPLGGALLLSTCLTSCILTGRCMRMMANQEVILNSTNTPKLDNGSFAMNDSNVSSARSRQYGNISLEVGTHLRELPGKVDPLPNQSRRASFAAPSESAKARHDRLSGSTEITPIEMQRRRQPTTNPWLTGAPQEEGLGNNDMLQMLVCVAVAGAVVVCAACIIFLQSKKENSLSEASNRKDDALPAPQEEEKKTTGADDRAENKGANTTEADESSGTDDENSANYDKNHGPGASSKVQFRAYDSVKEYVATPQSRKTGTKFQAIPDEDEEDEEDEEEEDKSPSAK
mmetsp:Transcript_10605/g.17785  ORF Transcript_10605/g.17785 Transcript_10605/m.17785 type:complete len:288 (+) Transcript_10605:63-926(+)